MHSSLILLCNLMYHIRDKRNLRINSYKFKETAKQTIKIIIKLQ